MVRCRYCFVAMRVLVVGAGIAGLSAALSLHAVGMEAIVVDAVAELRPLGVGINLLPHATEKLVELGVGEQLADTAVATAEVVHFDRWGNEIWREPRGVAAGHRWPQYSVHRGELQDLLLRTVRERLGPDAVRTGLRFVAMTQDRDGVHSTLHDRIRGTTVEFDSDVLIGADGLHSAVRAGLYPNEPGPAWNGIRMWRGTTISRPFESGATMIFGGSNHAAKFVAYPISEAARRQGRALINWVAEVRLPGSGDSVANWDHRGRIEDVLPHYDGWELAGLDIGALIRGSERILEYPMVDREPLPRWTFGRVTLMGDAAHPMYPIGSNGGSQAILDAAAVATALRDAADPAAGLAAYETARLASANETVLANRDMPMDRILRLVAERAPGGFDRIDDVVTPEELRAIGDGYRSTSSVR